MTTKTRYGVYGVAAIVAILSLSLVATNLTTQEATAEAARKAGVTFDDTVMTPAIQAASNEIMPVVDDIGTLTLKSNDKGDWMVEGVIECATAVQAKAKGKQADDPLSGGTAGAKVWITLDSPNDSQTNMISIETGDVTTDINEAQWNLCQQTFEMKSNFNDLIISCQEAADDYGYTGDACTIDTDGDGTDDTVDSSRLIFLCEVAPEGTECEQSLEVFTMVAGTHPIAYMLHNISAADTHTITVWAALSAGASQGSTIDSQEIIVDSENFVDAGVVIGKRLFSIETLAYQG